MLLSRSAYLPLCRGEPQGRAVAQRPGGQDATWWSSCHQAAPALEEGRTGALGNRRASASPRPLFPTFPRGGRNGLLMTIFHSVLARARALLLPLLPEGQGGVGMLYLSICPSVHPGHCMPGTDAQLLLFALGSIAGAGVKLHVVPDPSRSPRHSPGSVPGDGVEVALVPWQSRYQWHLGGWWAFCVSLSACVWASQANPPVKPKSLRGRSGCQPAGTAGGWGSVGF